MHCHSIRILQTKKEQCKKAKEYRIVSFCALFVIARLADIYGHFSINENYILIIGRVFYLNQRKREEERRF